jgi:hypothetical protein
MGIFSNKHKTKQTTFMRYSPSVKQIVHQIVKKKKKKKIPHFMEPEISLVFRAACHLSLF